MASSNTYTSPDRSLTFVTESGDDHHTILHFQDFPWHTHSDLLVGSYGSSEESAVQNFIERLLRNELVIAIYRRGNEVVDICVTDNPSEDLRYVPEGQTLEFRYWDSSAWSPENE